MIEILSLEKEVLGEACGIFAGKGSIYRTGRSYVLEVRGSAEELPYYRNHVRSLFERIFSKNPKIIRRSYPGGYVIGIRVCGPQVMKIFHVFLQFPLGKKSGRVKVPAVIMNNHEYWKHYVRGVFDTRGSVYLRRTGKTYRNPVIDIRSGSLEHLRQLREILRDMGFGFWLEKGNLRIRMAGWKNAKRFLKEIKPHNNIKLKNSKSLRWVSSKLGWPSG